MSNFCKGFITVVTALFGGALINGIKKRSYAKGWMKGYDTSKADYESQKMKEKFEELQRKNEELLKKLEGFEA